jgi:hypothetical protein
MKALLEAAGFTAAAKQVDALKERQRRLAIAYEHYRFVTREQVAEFNEKLRASTSKGSGTSETYDYLKFTDIQVYAGFPPKDVLEKVAEARKLEVFDALEVASLAHYPDPIVFGSIVGCGDHFYIAQWGDDVSIDDILGAHEG